jgi:hypothetical protein
MGRLLLLIPIVILVLLFLQWYRRTPPQQAGRALRKGLLWGAAALLLLAVLTGRLNPIFAALAALVPALMRLLHLLRMLPMLQQVLGQLGLGGAPGAGPGGAGGVSAIRTRYLDMQLDHTSGRMDGTVLEGPFEGRRLADLTLDQLLRMLELYQDTDAQSAAVLQAYLDRERGDDWRERAGHAAGSAAASPVGGPLSREDAYSILGLTPDADAEAIRAAHRRLMQKLHPDRGGSDFLAAQINAAKDRLLGE